MARPKRGRPTKYKREYVQAIYDYIKECEIEDKVPFIVEFCRRYGLTKEIISRYRKIRSEFNQSIEALNEAQEEYLVSHGLKRKVDPGFARFILAANHGYVETSKQINEGNQPVTIQVDMKGYVPPQATTQPQKGVPLKANPN